MYIYWITILEAFELVAWIHNAILPDQDIEDLIQLCSISNIIYELMIWFCTVGVLLLL